jgi:hypothetical protein
MVETVSLNLSYLRPAHIRKWAFFSRFEISSDRSCPYDHFQGLSRIPGVSHSLSSTFLRPKRYTSFVSLICSSSMCFFEMHIGRVNVKSRVQESQIEFASLEILLDFGQADGILMNGFSRLARLREGLLSRCRLYCSARIPIPSRLTISASTT